MVATSDFYQLIDALKADSANSLGLFMPEITLSVFIALFLAVRLVTNKLDLFWVALAGAVVGLISSNPLQLFDGSLVSEELFTGLLVHDGLTVAIRSILMLFLVLFLVFTKISGVPDKEDGADVYSLVFGSTLGMCLMASANHLLIVFMAIEMAGVPSYVLAGLIKGRKRGSESALKYAIYGAGAAGVMLYGISLIVGLTGTAHLPTMALALVEIIPAAGLGEQAVLCLAAVMIAVGIAFKLSAVPFHFWAPDVFHGACAEVNAFLSVASKAAALALLLRLAVGLGSVPLNDIGQPQADGVHQEAVLNDDPTTHMVAFENENVEGESSKAAEVVETAPAEEAVVEHDPRVEVKQAYDEALTPVRNFISLLVAFFAVVTATFGNLAAYGQKNIKRLLAYSTIAHAGYMMMAISPLMVMLGTDNNAAEEAASALIQYIVVYVFLNLGAFSIIAFLRNYVGSEEIEDYSGMVRSRPVLVICLALIFFSLVGLPPLSGFLGKFAIFASLADGYSTVGSKALLILLLAGGINTAISLFYYLGVIKTMAMGETNEEHHFGDRPVGKMELTYVILITIPTVFLIVCWQWVAGFADEAVKNFIS
ncbi:MAG: NADH-quinone oxidoreductase subunit N [Planctomycetota bacterium]|nr:NADH-quinone oxidoreductase subunit N [Planctomycetota bacterium]